MSTDRKELPKENIVFKKMNPDYKRLQNNAMKNHKNICWLLRESREPGMLTVDISSKKHNSEEWEGVSFRLALTSTGWQQVEPAPTTETDEIKKEMKDSVAKENADKYLTDLLLLLNQPDLFRSYYTLTDDTRCSPNPDEQTKEKVFSGYANANLRGVVEKYATEDDFVGILGEHETFDTEDDFDSGDQKRILAEKEAMLPAFICPLTHRLLQNPATTLVGTTYELSVARAWIKMKNLNYVYQPELRDVKDPLTKAIMGNAQKIKEDVIHKIAMHSPNLEQKMKDDLILQGIRKQMLHYARLIENKVVKNCIDGFLKGDMKAVQRELEDPLTHKPFVNPVLLEDGYTFERSEIEKWFKENVPPTNPITKQPVNPEIIINNTLVLEIQKQFTAYLNDNNIKLDTISAQSSSVNSAENFDRKLVVEGEGTKSKEVEAAPLPSAPRFFERTQTRDSGDDKKNVSTLEGKNKTSSPRSGV